MEEKSNQPRHSKILSGFESLCPPHSLKQADLTNWLTEAYSFHNDLPLNEIKEKMDKYSCKSDKVSKRMFCLEDFAHYNWEKMEVFSSSSEPKANHSLRSDFFNSYTTQAFEELYVNSAEPPRDLFHVTCTGYVSPSPAQKLAVGRAWDQTRVHHHYHMGCFGALSVIDLASRIQTKKNELQDIVHTELCTLNLDISKWTSEQIVINSLFADGIIKYSAGHQFAPDSSRGLGILRSLEKRVPNTTRHMTWQNAQHGMSMTLDRSVPIHIRNNLKAFLAELMPERNFKDCIFAIHPGGPAIVDLISEELGLSSWQTAHSKEILYTRGNMSSATLPHIWKLILEEREISSGTQIVSLAFGPGLTISGSLLEVIQS